MILALYGVLSVALMVFAPTIDVILDSGATVSLRSLYQDSKLGLIFLRHLGCPFCREQVVELRNYPEANLAFVVMASPEATRAFKEKLRSPHPFICDPTKALYRSFGLGSASLGQIFNTHTLMRGTALALKGVGGGRMVGDPFALAGSFVIDIDGKVIWEYQAKDAADNPEIHCVLDRLLVGNKT